MQCGKRTQPAVVRSSNRMQAVVLCRVAHSAAAAAATSCLPGLMATAATRSSWLTRLAAGYAVRNFSAAAASASGTSSSSDNNNNNKVGSAGSDGSQLHVTVEPLSGLYEGVSVISLNRPAARNAIGRQLLRELAEALDTVRQERTTRCVLVRSLVSGG